MVHAEMVRGNLIAPNGAGKMFPLSRDAGIGTNSILRRRRDVLSFDTAKTAGPCEFSSPAFFLRFISSKLSRLLQQCAP